MSSPLTSFSVSSKISSIWRCNVIRLANHVVVFCVTQEISLLYGQEMVEYESKIVFVKSRRVPYQIVLLKLPLRPRAFCRLLSSGTVVIPKSSNY